MRRATLTLPWPPSVNHLYATVRGRRVLSKKGREYHKAVAETVASQAVPPFGSARIMYSAIVYPPDRRRRDLSNLTKVVEDALTHAGVWDDDSQVDFLLWSRAQMCPGGSLFLEIEEIEQE